MRLLDELPMILKGGFMKKFFVTFFALACLAGAQDVLTNDAVVKMVKAGLADNLILSMIQNQPGKFSTTPDEMVKLKGQGVSDNVMAAMIAKASGGAVAPALTTQAGGGAPTGPATTADLDDPLANHDPGVYLLTTTRDGKKKLVQMERAGSNRAHTSNVLGAAFSYGLAKAKVKAEIDGPRASLRTEAKPEFYMYFPPTGSLGATETISSPSQFILERLDAKKDKREVAVAQMRTFGGTSAGADEKKLLKFNAEKIRPYAYKVTPDASIKAGEYAFIASSGVGGTSGSVSVVVFDFGVDQ
jgi:hypothetical protein